MRAQAQQAESYTATISHEMRTPLASAIFLLSFIIKFLMALNLTGKEGKD